MSEYYTRRQVELKDKGGASFMPMVQLQAMTKLTITAMVDPKRDGKFSPNATYWYEVMVDTGIHKNKVGYLHTDDFDTPEGLANLKRRSPEVSGTMYGLVRVEGMDQDGNLIQSWPWDARCTQCNEVMITHALYSIDDTLQAAHLILNEFRNTVWSDSKSQSLFKDQNKVFMIGCLIAKSSNIYASHSGQKSDDAFAKICRKLNLIYSPPVPKDGKLKNRNGDVIQLKKVQEFDYQCAAPRLIQHAISRGAYPDAMTEIYGGGPDIGKVIPSCRRCQQTVPYMLCP